jgi:predicted methyltransferase
VRRLRPTLPILILLWWSVGSVTAQDRRPFLDVFLALADVRPGMAVADVGAGNGAFSARLAGTVGPAGRIFANEISEAHVASDDARDHPVTGSARIGPCRP